MQERCRRCGADPFAGVGERLGPLSTRQLWLGLGWRVLVGLPLLGWLFWSGRERLPNWTALPNWAQLTLGVLGAIVIVSVLRQIWLIWRAAQVALVLTPNEAWLLQRRGGRVYLERMNWSDSAPPDAPRGWQLLEAVASLVRIATHVGLQAVSILIPDLEVYEMRLGSRFERTRVWRLALAGAYHHPSFTLTAIAQHALPHWLRSGVVRIEPGYEPSSERPFLALDLSTRTLRAYAFREVRLDGESMHITVSRESHNPDGSRVELDYSLEPDAAAAERSKRQRITEFTLPAYAAPYGDYWLRAEWGIIKRIESRRVASETATAPQPTPPLQETQPT